MRPEAAAIVVLIHVVANAQIAEIIEVRTTQSDGIEAFLFSWNNIILNKVCVISSL